MKLMDSMDRELFNRHCIKWKLSDIDMDCYSDTFNFSITNYLNYMIIRFFIFWILCKSVKSNKRLFNNGELNSLHYFVQLFKRIKQVFMIHQCVTDRIFSKNNGSMIHPSNWSIKNWRQWSINEKLIIFFSQKLGTYHFHPSNH